MNTVPIGRITAANELSAPVVVALSASPPSDDTISASVKPITAWVERASTTGQASARSGRRPMAGGWAAGADAGADTSRPG